MKLLLTAISSLALLLGCIKPPANTPHADNDDETQTESHEEGVTFNRQYGLSIPEETAHFIGLQIVDAEEKQVDSMVQFNARVYDANPAANSPVKATAFVSEPEAAALSARTNVTGRSDNSGPVMQGKVLKVKARSANGLIEVLLEFAPGDVELSIGDYLMVSVPSGTGQMAVTVPRRALLKTVEGTFVYTVSGKRLVRTAVKVGRTTEDIVEITDGLYTGDQVALQPVMTLWMAELQSIRGGQACADGH